MAFSLHSSSSWSHTSIQCTPSSDVFVSLTIRYSILCIMEIIPMAQAQMKKQSSIIFSNIRPHGGVLSRSRSLKWFLPIEMCFYESMLVIWLMFGQQWQINENHLIEWSNTLRASPKCINSISECPQMSSSGLSYYMQVIKKRSKFPSKV